MKKAPIILIVTMVVLLVVGTAAAASGNALQPLIDIYSRLTGQSVAEAIDEPISVSHNGTTVTLARTMASGSQTVVEFHIDSSMLPNDQDAMRDYQVKNLFYPGEDMSLEGFEREEVISRAESKSAGQLQYIMELPAPASFDTPVVIEIEHLDLWQQQDGYKETIPLGGPWRFEFTPHVPEAQREQREVALDIEGGNDDVAIAIDRYQRSSTETVITYRLLPPTHENLQSMGAETLILGDERFEARGKDGTTTPDEIEARSHTISFPSLPADADRFMLEFGPFWMPQESPVEVELDIEKLLADGQDVSVEGYDLHFWIEPSQEMYASEELHYRPVDGSIPFTLSGPTADLRLEDDLGQTYSVMGGTTDHDTTHGLYLKQQMYRIVEPLQEGATTLTFRISKTGKIVDPFQIPITLP